MLGLQKTKDLNKRIPNNKFYDKLTLKQDLKK